MAKYIIKKHDEKWIWDFESEKLKLRFTADSKKFESNADILAFLKELKFYEADKLQIEENHLILNGEIITENTGPTGSGNYEDTINNIKIELQNLGISASLDNIPNVADVSMIINGYSPPDENKRPLSLAFSINNSLVFNSKCWLTEQNLKDVEGRHIPYHRGYGEFTYLNKIFHPFSVNLQDYKVNAKIIKILCGHFYRHIPQDDFYYRNLHPKNIESGFNNPQEINEYVRSLRD